LEVQAHVGDKALLISSQTTPRFKVPGES